MNSAEILAGLPPVFTTRDYQQATRVKPSSASRALRALAEQGAISKIRRAAWRNPEADVPQAEDLLAKPGPPRTPWTSVWEIDLNAVYGDTPRRISGLAALTAAGVPLICGLEVTVEQSKAVDTRRFGFATRRESAATLLVDTIQITDGTWVSSPARAVMECAQYPARCHRYEEHIGRMIVNGFDVCTPEEAHDVAAKLNWRAAMRRIASLAQGLSESGTGRREGFLVSPSWMNLADSAHRGDDWVFLTPFKSRRASDRGKWSDDRRKVLWDTTPEELALETAT